MSAEVAEPSAVTSAAPLEVTPSAVAGAEEDHSSNETPSSSSPSPSSASSSSSSSPAAIPTESFVIHPLEHKWTLWTSDPSSASSSKPSSSSSSVQQWTSNLRIIHSFDTVEEFWRTFSCLRSPSLLPMKHDLYLFRHEIEPEWEHPKNLHGGKWQITVNKEMLPLKFASTLDALWLQILLLCIGEGFGPTMEGEEEEASECLSSDLEEINGVILAIRPRETRIALWTRHASNQAAQLRIGKQWKKKNAHIFPEARYEYVSHADTQYASKNYGKAPSALTL